MRLKTFTAKTMNEAMQMVRDALGEDAVIISTREERGKGVHVTAAVEKDLPVPVFEWQPRKNEDGTKPPREEPAEPAWLQYDPEQADEEQVAEILTEAMLRHSVPEDITDSLISASLATAHGDPVSALSAALEQHFGFTPLPQRSHPRVLVMVGAPGAGKTLVAAKLAARAALNGRVPLVISTDTVRAGGVEQLQAFTRILGLDLHTAANARELRKITEERGSGADQIIVDTGGLNPFDAKEMKELAKIANAVESDPVVVMPAGLDAEETSEIARAFGILGARRMVSTRLDIARRLGGLLASADQAGLGFAEISATPQVVEGLNPLNPGKLAELLMPRSWLGRHNKNNQSSGTGTGTPSRKQNDE